MTQVITVSANTAAYAMEAMKPPQRNSRAGSVEKRARTAATQSGEAGVTEAVAACESVKSLPAGLPMMNPGERQPQATVKQAIDAYKRAGS